ncbi:MAG: TolC family protein, partial [Nitrospirae bacterium]
MLLTLLLLPGLALAAATPSATPSAAPPGGSRPELEALVAEALAHNPRIRAARFAAEAARQRPAQARSLDDPQAGVAWYLQEVETRVGPQEARFFLSQKLPFWGKRALRGEAARHGAEAAAATARQVELEVVTELARRYYDLAYVDESIRITEADKALVADIVEAALAHYRAGHGQQRDVLRAQVALSRDTDRLLALRARRATLVARIDALLGRDPATPLA